MLAERCRLSVAFLPITAAPSWLADAGRWWLPMMRQARMGRAAVVKRDYAHAMHDTCDRREMQQ